MLTVLLWITLVASILFLVIIASPVRLAADVSYRRPDKVKYRIVCTYIHPAVFKYEYPSTKVEKAKKPKKAKKAGNDGSDGSDGISTEKKSADGGDIDIRRVDGGVNTDTNAERVDCDVNNGTDKCADDDIGTFRPSAAEERNERRIDDNNTNINTNRADNTGDTGKKIKKASLLSRIKARVSDVQNHKIYRLLASRPLRKKLSKWLPGLIIRSLRLVSFERLRLHAVVGYSDPAALGRLYGYFEATRSMLELRSRSVDLSMEPVFTGERLEVDGELALRTTVSVVLWQALVLLVTFPYLGVYGVLRKPKRVKRRGRQKGAPL